MKMPVLRRRAFSKGLAALFAVSAVGLLGISLLGISWASDPHAQPGLADRTGPDAQAIDRGRYIAVAGDCVACHTRWPDGKPFAGGYPISSPFGAIYSTNITPSKRHGIGNYSLEQFEKALRHGVRADGANLYPAMPYTSYSNLSDKDIGDLYAYIMHEVSPVEATQPPTKLPFPFSMRSALGAWKVLNRRAVPENTEDGDAGRSEAWQRGRYLVDGLAHCAECHSPRNAMLGLDASRYLQGGNVGPWHAPNITNDPVNGIGAWSEAEVRAYLATGKTSRARASGPMAEAVEHSLQYLTPDDIGAITTYLRTVSGSSERNSVPQPASTTTVTPHRIVGQVVSQYGRTSIEGVADGSTLYRAACATCHQPDGSGTRDGYYPSLKGVSAVVDSDPTNLLAKIVYGVHRDAAGVNGFMPAFGPQSPVQALTDVQIAAVANYVTARFGHGQTLATPEQVKITRAGGPTPAIAWLADYRLWIVVALVAVVVVYLLLRRLLRSSIPSRKEA